MNTTESKQKENKGNNAKPSAKNSGSEAVALSGKEIRVRTERRQRDRDQEWEHKVLDIARVTRVTAGGKRFSFRAVVVAGNKKGRVGVGIGKSGDLQKAIEKGINEAKKLAITITQKGTTIPFPVLEKYNSARVYLKPTAAGSGVKAGGPIRVIAKLGGLQDVSAKLISRTNNKINIARATIKALVHLGKKNARGLSL